MAGGLGIVEVDSKFEQIVTVLGSAQQLAALQVAGLQRQVLLQGSRSAVRTVEQHSNLARHRHLADSQRHEESDEGAMNNPGETSDCRRSTGACASHLDLLSNFTSCERIA